MIKVEKKVFTPNATTGLLVEALKNSKKKSDILDLVCAFQLRRPVNSQKTKLRNKYFFQCFKRGNSM